MNELNKALDDLDGLHEAFHALSDPLRASPLVRNAKLGKKLRHDLAAGADAYASTLISIVPRRTRRQANQEVPRRSPRTNARCRCESERLAALVNERRVPNPEVRSDVQLLLISLSTAALHWRLWRPQ